MPDRPQFTVLCVDDNEDARTTLAFVLSCEGYHVLEAPTGQRALELARAADLVILDVRLPDLHGVEVCRRIKADPATALVPVILLSGHYTRSENKAEGLEEGADSYFTKPAEPRELLGQVKALLRIRRTELLLEQQARILDQIHDAVVATDLEGRVRRWNRGAELLFGHTAAEMLGRHVGPIYPPVEPEVATQDVLAALHRGGSFELEKRVRQQSGEDVFVHSSLSLLRDGLGKPAGVIAYSIDVTERKRLEEQLLQAQKLEAIGQLAGGVAHDFNNLMAIITAHADLLLARLSANDPCRELAEPIKHAGERAAVLTRQLLAFSRKTILDPRVLDLNELIQEASRLLRSVLGEGIELVLALSPELGRVRADPHQLEQVLLNLAVNARDAMPQGGKVTIRTEDVELRSSSLNLNVPVRPGPYVALSLSDTGCGMTPEVQARIFEPFFTTKEVGRGTGLGLAMVYGFVRQSDGHIEVRSEPGQGATFTIYLPRAEDVGAPAPSEPRTEPAQQAQ